MGGQEKQENSDSDTSLKEVSWKTETLRKITLVAFWFTTPCTLVGGNQYFGRTRCLYLQGRKFGAVSSSKTLGTAYYTTRCHNPRDHNINFCCRENSNPRIADIEMELKGFRVDENDSDLHPISYCDRFGELIDAVLERM
jgi:hypothetical protein